MSVEATAYINAGGRGTRLNSVLPPDPEIGITKALIVSGTEGEPILAYHVKRFLTLGFQNIVVACGDHEVVADYTESTFGNLPEVDFVVNRPQAGTGGDLRMAIKSRPELFGNIALVANCDTLLDINEPDLISHHNQLGAEATLAVTTARDVPNRGAFTVAPTGRVFKNREAGAVAGAGRAPRGSYRASSCGMVALNTEVLAKTGGLESDFSIYRHYLGLLTARGTLVAYNNGERFFMDIGVPSTYEFIKQNPAVIDDLSQSVLAERATRSVKETI